jgi:hypothetical protein
MIYICTEKWEVNRSDEEGDGWLADDKRTQESTQGQVKEWK